MATFEMERLPGENLVLCTMHEDFNVVTDTDEVASRFDELINGEPGMFSIIADATAVKPTLSDAWEGASVAARGKNAFLHHSQIQEVLFITTNDLLRLAVRGLNSEIFGFVRTSVYDTFESALAKARGQSE